MLLLLYSLANSLHLRFLMTTPKSWMIVSIWLIFTIYGLIWVYMIFNFQNFQLYTNIIWGPVQWLLKSSRLNSSSFYEKQTWKLPAIAILLASLIPWAYMAISTRSIWINERALVCGQQDSLALSWHFVNLVFAMTEPKVRFQLITINTVSIKKKIAKLYLKYKLEAYSSKVKHWDPKRKKFVAYQQSFKSRAVRDFFPTLKNTKSDI